MTTDASPLQTIEDLRLAVNLQQALLGERSHGVWQLPQLLEIQRSGGLLLGIRETAPAASPPMLGLLIDLLAEVDDYPARRTAIWGVDERFRNKGMGTRLREIERLALQRRGVDLVMWDIDPLNSVELHIALNKLGGILTGYTQDALGSARDPRTPGLASDRVRVEWWIDSPRVNGLMDRGLPLPYQQIGLQAMTVVTKTTILPTGVRGLQACEGPGSAGHVLAEIPESLSDVLIRDFDAAAQWRTKCRDAIAGLFELGFLGVGLIHEAGRSFLLFSKGTRKSELSAIGGR
jgi:predicted GNAT superfamily acetyltransferase